jgi:hypothetical protein
MLLTWNEERDVAAFVPRINENELETGIDLPCFQVCYFVVCIWSP